MDGIGRAEDLCGMVEISEVHENLLQDLLTERFGWSWNLKQDHDTKAMVNESTACHRNSSTRSAAGTPK